MCGSDAGIVKVYAPQAGIVLERHIREGQAVDAGDILFVVSSDRSSVSQGDTQGAISAKLQDRQANIAAEIEKTRLLQQHERQTLEHRISGVENELATVDSEKKNQQARLHLAEVIQSRYQSLQATQLVSTEQLQQKTADLFDQRARFQSIERDKLRLKRELEENQAQLADRDLADQNQISQIQRLLVATGQEFVESEAKRRLLITAPTSGTITAVLPNLGESVDGTNPLVSIIPAGAGLHAELYAPSRAVGFVRTGDPVLIRYAAFPYQKFGNQKGTVKSVSRTVLPTNELKMLGAWTDANDTEPRYRITVKLESQAVLAYGQRQPLQAGMILDADVLQEKRRLIEWVFEPLLSLSGKL